MSFQDNEKMRRRIIYRNVSGDDKDVMKPSGGCIWAPDDERFISRITLSNLSLPGLGLYVYFLVHSEFNPFNSPAVMALIHIRLRQSNFKDLHCRHLPAAPPSPCYSSSKHGAQHLNSGVSPGEGTLSLCSVILTRVDEIIRHVLPCVDVDPFVLTE